MAQCSESFVGAGAKAFAQHIVQERVAKGVPFSAQYHVPQGRFMDPEGSSAVAKHLRRALWNTQQVSGVSPAISARAMSELRDASNIALMFLPPEKLY